MTADERELELWRELNVLAETDAILGMVMHAAYHTPMHRSEAMMTGLKAYAHMTASLQSQLLEAVSTQPRVYVLSKP